MIPPTMLPPNASHFCPSEPSPKSAPPMAPPTSPPTYPPTSPKTAVTGPNNTAALTTPTASTV